MKVKPYRLPLNHKKIVEQAVKDMAEAGIIRRSHSPYSAPVVIVKKKDGTHRFCVDYRKLNKITKPNSYPLLNIDELLAILDRSKYFTCLDLRSGYWNIKIAEED